MRNSKVTHGAQLSKPTSVSRMSISTARVFSIQWLEYVAFFIKLTVKEVEGWGTHGDWVDKEVGGWGGGEVEAGREAVL